MFVPLSLTLAQRHSRLGRFEDMTCGTRLQPTAGCWYREMFRCSAGRFMPYPRRKTNIWSNDATACKSRKQLFERLLARSSVKDPYIACASMCIISLAISCHMPSLADGAVSCFRGHLFTALSRQGDRVWTPPLASTPGPTARSQNGSVA